MSERIYGEKMSFREKNKGKAKSKVSIEKKKEGERERIWSDMARWIKSNPMIKNVIRVDRY